MSDTSRDTLKAVSTVISILLTIVGLFQFASKSDNQYEAPAAPFYNPNDPANRDLEEAIDRLNERPLSLPEGVYIDTLAYYDSLSQTEVEILLPSTKNTQLKKPYEKIKDLALKQQDIFKRYFLEDKTSRNQRKRKTALHTLRIRPTKLFTNGKIISHFLVVNAHHGILNRDYVWNAVFNYDLASEEVLDTHDFFELKDESSYKELASFMSGKVYPWPKNDQDMDDRCEVHVSKETLSIIYGYLGSQQKAEFHFKDINPYLKKKYRREK